MLRFLTVLLLTLGAAFSATAQTGRPVNQVSIVALIITSNGETPVSLSVTRTLESLDAQTLTADAPNASQIRSILKRFNATAINSDIALVYFDGAVLKLGARSFVAPGGIELRRPSDLLTRAIPLSALARATALAGNGGAVLVHSSGQNINLIDGVTLVETAPPPRTGTSPILFASSAAAANLADGLEAMVDAGGDIDLSEALGQLAALDGVSISQMPARAAMLRKVAPAIAAVAANPVANAETGDQGMVLPQVGTEITTEAAQPADTATESPTTNAPTSTQISTPAETAAVTIAGPADSAAPVDPAAAVSDLPLDVLRAQQGALTRAHKRILQRHLRNLGFYRGLIDGIFGRQTERAISAYQESIGAAVTGVLTPAQLGALSE